MSVKKFNTFLYLKDLISVLYPDLCLACQNRLGGGESVVCFACLSNLPKTNFEYVSNNPVAKIFWGRISLVGAAAFLYFSPAGMVQKMVHHLKYKGNKQIGLLLGKLYGIDLLKSTDFNNVDVIVPVPLHPDKLKKRGYNQSEIIALGLSKSLGVLVNSVNLTRAVFTETQTKKSRYKRWENVDDIFKIRHPDVFEGKHVLLVDDVITTGATIEACAQELLKIDGCKVSVVAIATAMRL